VADDGHFVGKGAIDDPEGVLEDLGHLRFLRGGDGKNWCLENCLVEGLGVFRTGGGAPAHHFGSVLCLIEEVAGVDPLGGEGKVEVLPHGEALSLEDRLEDLLGGAGPGGGLEDHEHVLVGVLGHGTGGGLHVGHIGLLVVVQRSGNADGDHVAFGDPAEI